MNNPQVCDMQDTAEPLVATVCGASLGDQQHTPESAALRRQQRIRFHALSPAARAAYLIDLEQRDAEDRAVAAIIDRSPPQDIPIERQQIDALTDNPPRPVRAAGPYTRIYRLRGGHAPIERLCELAGVDRTVMVGRLRVLCLTVEQAVEMGPCRGTPVAPQTAATAPQDDDHTSDYELELAEDDDDYLYEYVQPRQRKGKTVTKFRSANK
jgi:hypothetical protein